MSIEGTSSISGSTFTGNAARRWLAPWSIDFNDLTVASSTFTSNSAADGGAIYVEAAPPRSSSHVHQEQRDVRRRDLVGGRRPLRGQNTALPAEHHRGLRAAPWRTMTTPPCAEDSHVQPTTPVAEYGGGVYAEGDNTTISGITLNGNSAPYGGGIYNHYNALAVRRLAHGNTAQYGAGVYNGGPGHHRAAPGSSRTPPRMTGGGLYNATTRGEPVPPARSLQPCARR